MIPGPVLSASQCSLHVSGCTSQSLLLLFRVTAYVINTASSYVRYALIRARITRPSRRHAAHSVDRCQVPYSNVA